ncbi:MAG: hypothetical protein Ct9H90mP11_06460 [Acidimicrobiales bacterium]|nr:MAG: hypothetical protein Ct9H90mP11_06460 [Acidimicrobiales bacterium]
MITAGIIVLNQGFDKDNSATSVPVPNTQETQETEEQNQEIEQETTPPYKIHQKK